MKRRRLSLKRAIGIGFSWTQSGLHLQISEMAERIGNEVCGFFGSVGDPLGGVPEEPYDDQGPLTGEYFFDTRNPNGSFFYSWLQVTYSPTDWFRLGIVAQRAKAYHTSLDTQCGLLVGFSPKKVQFTTYVFNLGWTSPAFGLLAGI